MAQIIVKSPKTGREVSFEKNFGSTLEESVGLFGANVVHSTFVAQATIRAQGAARGVLDKDNRSKEDAIAAGISHTPGVARRGGFAKTKDPYEVLVEQVVSGELNETQLWDEIQRRLASRTSSA